MAASVRRLLQVAVQREFALAAKLADAEEGLNERAFLGTSGWAYPSWKPGFYPQRLPQKKFLEYYATRLNSVEANYSFQNSLTEEILANWLAASGPSFRFSLKAPQRITHMLRLKDCADEVATFSQMLAPLVAAGRIGVVLFQLPPNFKVDMPRLESLLSHAVRHELRMAFEFRHASWFCDELFAVLRQHGVALCVAESDDLQTPDVVTAPFTYYRFRKSKYSAARLNAIADLLRKRSVEGEVFAYFKHEDEPTGAIRAVKTLRKLRRL